MVKSSSLCFVLAILLTPFHAQYLMDMMENLQVISSENIEPLEQVATIDTESNIILDIEWSPDGNYLAVLGVSDRPYVEIWNFQSHNVSLNLITSFVPELVSSIHWLPDNNHIATHGQQYLDGNLHSYVAVWDAIRGEVTEILLDTQTEPGNCCDPIAQPIVGWNNDYSISATLEANHTFQLTTGQVFTFRDPSSLFSTDYTEEPAFGTIVDALWSPNDRYIAVEHATQDHYRFHIVDAQTLEPVLYFHGEDYWTCELVWSPDDTSLAVISERISAGSNTSATQIHLYPVDEPVCYGDCGTVLWLDSANLFNNCKPAFAWSPDGRMVSIGTATTIDFYETSELGLTSSLSDENAFVLDWHPSQKILTIGGINGTIRLWAILEND